MAQTVAVVRASLTATGSGTTDFTASGFGTPTAAIIITSEANTTNNPEALAGLSIGFWDGTNQWACAYVDNDNVGTTVGARRSDDSYGVIVGATASNYTVSAVTDGIRLTLSVDNTTVERYCTVILLAGVSAKRLTFTPNATQNGTQESASIGFEPKLLIFVCVGATTADTNSNEAILSFGFAANDGTHRMIGFGSDSGAGTSATSLLYSETRCTGQVFNTLGWALEITTWGSDTFTATTRDGASGSDVCFALALGGADLSFDCGTLTTPAGTGNDAVSTGVQPDALLLFLSTATGTTIHTDGNSEGLCIGLSDGTNDYFHNSTSGDNLDTSNTQSEASATAVIGLDEESSGFSRLATATVDSFNAANFTLNYTAVPGTARKGWWLAFGEAAAPPATNRRRRLLIAGARS